MQAIDLLLQRHSARGLTEPAPDEGALALIFASATRAPDHGRLRPWRFILIRDEARARLGDLFADHLRRVRTQAGVPASDEALTRERLKAFRAPIVIVVAAIVKADGKIPPIEQILSAGAAAHGMLLAALALGFNAVWKTGGAAYDEVVKGELGLASKDAIVGFLYVGSESRDKELPQRAAWQDFVTSWT